MRDAQDWAYFVERKFTRREMDQAIEHISRRLVVNRVIRRGRHFDEALKILEIRETPEGLIVFVS